MKKIMLVLMFLIAVNAKADGESMINSANALQNIIQKKNIPDAMVKKTVAVVVLPGVHQAGFFLGGLVGHGLIVRRDDMGWSEPFNISLKGGSLGLQFGYQKSDMVFFILNQNIANDIMTSKVTLGVDATITAWNVGDNYVDMTDIKFTSDIYAFASNKGLFAGISFGGAVFSVDTNTVSSTEYATRRWQSVLDMLVQ